MNSRSRLSYIVGLSILVIAVISIGRIITGAPKDLLVSGSLAKSYRTIEQLKEDTLVVVHGKIKAIEKVDTGFPPHLGSTYFAFNINKVVFPTEFSLPGEITVRQYGYSDDKVKRELREDPIMNVGEDYVLFLKLADNKQFYWIIGGPQGRFAVRNGKVHPMSTLLSPALHYGADGESIEDFIQKVNVKAN